MGSSASRFRVCGWTAAWAASRRSRSRWRATLQSENWRESRRGGDPWADRTRRTWASETSKVPTVAWAFDAVLALHRASFKDPETAAAEWRSFFDRHVLPKLGKITVDAVTAAVVLAVVEPLWMSKRTTAKRVRTRISKVRLWCIAHGYRTDDPAGPAVLAVLPKGGAAPRKHMAAMPHRQVGAALRKLDHPRIYPMLLHCLRFIAHTATRSQEARGARWAEIDFDAAVWTIPAERMKAGRVHRAPLSTAALAVLAEAWELSSDADLVFPSARGKVIADGTLLRGLVQSGTDFASVHGFRSSFRDWCGDTGQPREVAEHALAHALGSAVEQAYARSDLLERRRELMQAWSEYIDTASDV